MNITTEQGKTLKDAHGDVFRGLGQCLYFVVNKILCRIITEFSGWCWSSENLLVSYSEVVEHACGTATLQMGEYVSNVSNGIDTYSIREPLGVCAGICPFNFPAMIPLWVSLLSSSPVTWLNWNDHQFFLSFSYTWFILTIFLTSFWFLVKILFKHCIFTNHLNA